MTGPFHGPSMGLVLPICRSVCCDPSALDNLARALRLGWAEVGCLQAEEAKVARSLAVSALIQARPLLWPSDRLPWPRKRYPLDMRFLPAEIPQNHDQIPSCHRAHQSLPAS